MMRLTALFIGCLLFAACNEATDGNADTDTTNFPVDTNRFTNPNDSVYHQNTSSGTLIDSVAIDKRGGEGAAVKPPSSPTSKTTRKTAPNNSVRIDTLRQ